MFAISGASLGARHAEDYIKGNICREVEVEIEKTEMSCQKMILITPYQNKSELVGITIFKTKGTTYFLSNNHSYVIEDQKVISVSDKLTVNKKNSGES